MGNSKTTSEIIKTHKNIIEKLQSGYNIIIKKKNTVLEIFFLIFIASLGL